MSVLLLMMVCVGITKTIRDGIPRPIISTETQQPDNSADPMQSAQTQQQETPAPGESELPVQTSVPAPVVNNPVVSGSGRKATIRAIGDVIIDKEMLENSEIGKEVYDFSPMFELAHGVMSNADWTMINIDASLRRGVYGYSGYPTFCTPPSILDVLKECGVDMLTMCNNHALDRYFDGLKESLDLADAAGLAHVGAYRTQEEFDTPEVYDINGIKVGMLNYTQYTNGMAEKSDKAATLYGMRLMKGADYAGDIADLKDAGAEFVIAIMHWGTEYQRQPDSDIEVIAKRLVAAGADLIIGGHPHVVQPAEYITATDANGNSRTALCIYSIGNYLSEHRHENAAYTDNGVIFEFTLQENEQGIIELVDPNCIPVYMWQIDMGGGKHDYRVVPTGEYLNNPPAGMSDSQYQRMLASWNELVQLFNGVLPVNAN